jgi:dienelactone hydrolase
VILLPDKRGSEKSEGSWRTASFEDLATDTEAAIAFLRHQDEVGISTIGVIGLSQGGHIAPIVADRTQEIGFLVNIVGAAIPMHDLLVYEETHNLRELGVLPGLSELLAYPAAWSVRIRQREFWNAVGNFDPRPYWQALSVPSLVLYGQNDTNVPSIKSAEALRSLGNRNIDIRIYEDSGHALESPEGAGNSVFREDALRDIRDFIHSASTGAWFRPVTTDSLPISRLTTGSSGRSAEPERYTDWSIAQQVLAMKMRRLSAGMERRQHANDKR